MLKQLFGIMILIVTLGAVTMEVKADMKSVYHFDFEALPAELIGEGQLRQGKPGHGQALFFGGKSYLAIRQLSPEFLAAENEGVLTFECWYYREEDDETGFLVRQDGGFSILDIPWDPRRLNVGVSTPAGYQSFDSEPCLKAGVWQHVGLVIDGTDVRLYVNGHLEIKQEMPAKMQVCHRPLVIGAGFNGDNEEVIGLLPGSLDSVEISAEAKGNAWAAAVAASTSENFEAVQNTIGKPPVCNPGKEITDIRPLVSEFSDDFLVVENSFYWAKFQLRPCLKLEQLYNKFTDCNCLQDGGTDLFSVRVDGKYSLGQDFQVVKVESDSQNGADGNPILKVTVQAVQESGVEMTLKLTFDSSADIRIGSEMKNGKAAHQLMATVPVVENVSIGPDFNENYYFWPHLTGWVGNKSYELGMGYGHRCWIQLTDVFSPTMGGGLSLRGLDVQGVQKGICTRKTKRNGKIGVDYNILWLPGEDVKSRIFNDSLSGCAMAFNYRFRDYDPEEMREFPDAVLSVHRGDILVPLMDYARWSKEAFPHDPIPETIRDDFNLVAVHRQVGNRGFEKGFFHDGRMALADFVNPDGRDHNLQVAMWWHYKNPGLAGGSGEGDYEYDPLTGGKDGLIRSIQEANAKGAKVSLYTCSRQVSNDSTVAVQHPEWQFFYKPGVGAEDWGSFNPCTSVAEWQDIFVGHNVRIVNDLPVSNVYLDTTAETLSCYNPDHPHARNPEDDIFALLKKAKTRIKAARPDIAIMTEYLGSEAFGMYIDACWIQTFANPHAHAFNNYDLDFARFVYPRIHYAEWGQSDKTFEVDARRAFFNGVAAGRGDLTDEQNQRFADMTNTQREISDALASDNPVPFIPTYSADFYVNCFPGERQVAYTYYNKGGKQVVAMPVPQSWQDLRFVELLNDRELPVENGRISWEADDIEVGAVAVFERIINVTGNEISLQGNYPASARLFLIPAGCRDSKDNRIELELTDGQATFQKTGEDRILVKLLDGEMLIDEVVIK